MGLGFVRQSQVGRRGPRSRVHPAAGRVWWPPGNTLRPAFAHWTPAIADIRGFAISPLQVQYNVELDTRTYPS